VTRTLSRAGSRGAPRASVWIDSLSVVLDDTRRTVEGERGRLQAHDPFELIRWLALSQPDPRKALAEKAPCGSEEERGGK